MPGGATSVEPDKPAASSKFDCFYVYPTSSPQKTPNANLKVQEAVVVMTTGTT